MAKYNKDKQFYYTHFKFVYDDENEAAWINYYNEAKIIASKIIEYESHAKRKNKQVFGQDSRSQRKA